MAITLKGRILAEDETVIIEDATIHSNGDGTGAFEAPAGLTLHDFGQNCIIEIENDRRMVTVYELPLSGKPRLALFK